MTTHPCVSLWQPYGSALFMSTDNGGRVKAHETRHWAPPSRLIGQRVAIHVAKRPVRADDLYDKAEDAMRHIVGADWRKIIPYGAIIGTAVLQSVHRVEHDSMHLRVGEGPGAPASTLDYWFGDWSPGRYLWLMEEPQLLTRPIPLVGRQGWFTAEIPDV